MYLADCIAKECQWDYLVEKDEPESEEIGKMLESLHVLVKHPDSYKELTGKDPDAVAYERREIIRTVRRIL